MQVQEICPRLPSARTNDGILTAQVTPRNPDMLGHLVYQGGLQPVGRAVATLKAVLDSVPKAQRGKARAMVARDLSSYANEMESSSSMKEDQSGTLTSARPEKEFDSDRKSATSDAAYTLANFQKNPAMVGTFYADRTGSPASTHDASQRGPQTIAEINAANRACHANPEPFRLGREWGKG